MRGETREVSEVAAASDRLCSVKCVRHSEAFT
jgi:hypothetical protein